MGCDFCISVDVGGCEFDEDYTVKLGVSSEPFKCYECNEDFPAGVECEFATATTDVGEQFSCTTCLDCADIAKAFCCDGRMHGSLWTDLEESIDAGAQITTGCLSKLTRASAKAKVRDLWNEMTLGAAKEAR